MSDQLHRFLPALLLVAAFSAHAADLPASELLKVADDALQAGTITQLEHRQTVAWIKARPCSGIDRRLGAARKAGLEAAISRQEGGKTVAVYQALSYRGWHIVSSNAGQGDQPYLFYPADPVKGSKPVTVWAGAASIFETTAIKDWVRKEAPGIPARLADCFARHVTMGEN